MRISDWSSYVCSSDLPVTSITLRGVLGTRPVLLALVVVVAAQVAFTYVPVMQALFETQPVGAADGILVVAAGIVLMLVLEQAKVRVRRFVMFEDGVM